MTDFILHERLEADTVYVTTLSLCRVLLMQDRRFPWMILVPERLEMRDLHDLSTEDQIIAMGEIDTASRTLQAIYSPDKINVAALGNMVPQLHIHVIARFTDDAAWPGPVWGVGKAVAYQDEELAKTLGTLRNALD